MAKAGAYLNMSQSAVSQAIAAIEHTLGVPLLDRTSRGVEPTIYASALLRHAGRNDAADARHAANHHCHAVLETEAIRHIQQGIGAGRPSFGSAHRSFGTRGVQPGRRGS